MNFERSRQLIEGRIKDNWSTTSIVWDNTPGKVIPDSIRPTILDGESEQVTIGDNGCHRRYGVLVIQVFVAKDSGTSTIRGYCDTLANLFKNVKLETVTFESPTIVRVGDVDTLFQMNVQAPFYVDVQ